VSGAGQTGTTKVDADDVYYEVRGEGDPLVLLHSGMGSSREWDALAPRLGGHLRVYAYDRRGIGRSSGEAFRGDLVERGIDELSRFMDGLGIDRAHLFGSCLGGAIALGLASRDPGRVRSVVTTGVLFRGGPAMRERLSTVFRPWDRMPVPFQQMLNRAQGTADSKAFYERFRRMYAEGEAVGYASSPEYDLRDRLGRIACPVLAVHGDRDPFWGVDQPASAYSLILKSALWVVPYCGHFPHLEHPQAVATQALQFLGGE
jgi:3-oxoadipate enol-lactonase